MSHLSANSQTIRLACSALLLAVSAGCSTLPIEPAHVATFPPLQRPTDSAADSRQQLQNENADAVVRYQNPYDPSGDYWRNPMPASTPYAPPSGQDQWAQYGAPSASNSWSGSGNVAPAQYSAPSANRGAPTSAAPTANWNSPSPPVSAPNWNGPPAYPANNSWAGQNPPPNPPYQMAQAPNAWGSASRRSAPDGCTRQCTTSLGTTDNCKSWRLRSRTGGWREWVRLLAIQILSSHPEAWVCRRR